MKRGAGILVPVAGRQPCGLIRLTFSSFSLPQTVWFLVNGGYGFRSAPEPKGVSAGRRLPRRERRIGCLYRRFCLLGPRGVAHEVKTNAIWVGICVFLTVTYRKVGESVEAQALICLLYTSKVFRCHNVNGWQERIVLEIFQNHLCRSVVLLLHIVHQLVPCLLYTSTLKI